MHRKPHGCLDKSHNLKNIFTYQNSVRERLLGKFQISLRFQTSLGSRERVYSLGNCKKSFNAESGPVFISHTWKELHKYSGFWKTFLTRFIQVGSLTMQYESSPVVLSPHFYKTIHTREQPYKCFVFVVLQTVCTPYWVSENSPWGEAPDITGKKLLTEL